MTGSDKVDIHFYLVLLLLSIVHLQQEEANKIFIIMSEVHQFLNIIINNKSNNE